MVPLMRFKDFIWSKNPETFNISITRDIKESTNIKKCTEIISSTKNVLEKAQAKKYLIGSKLIKYFGVNNFISLLRVVRI